MAGPSRRYDAVATVAFLTLLGSLTHIATAQTTRVQGKSEQARIIARNDIPLSAAGPGRLEGLFRILKSENREWDDAQVFSVRFSNPEMRQQGIMQGHMVVIQADGDRAFLEYEFTWTSGVTSDFRLTGRFVGGTGKFKSIRGRWTEKGRSTVTEDTSEWEVEY
jgi:hypothetical protein